MSVSSLFALLAQSTTAGVSPVVLVLGGATFLLFVVAAYLVFVPIPMLQTALADTRRQREQEREQLDQQLRAERETADQTIGVLKSRIRNLREEADGFSELPKTKSALQDAELALHVQGRLQERLNEDAKAVAERHVEVHERDARLLRDAALETHVRRRTQQRLEDRIQEQQCALRTGERSVTELTTQIESLQSDVRAQSETAIEKRLADVQRESDRLRSIQERLQSSELSPQERLQALLGNSNT
jgi:hypothetical protein